MLPVAFEVLSATAPHASRKPAAHADHESSTPFADMLDKPDTLDQGTPKDQASPDQASPDQDAPAAPIQAAPAAQISEADTATNAKASVAPDAATASDEPALEIAANSPPPDLDAPVDALFAVIAEVTGHRAAPVATPKTEAKPADAPKGDDQGDDDAPLAPPTAAPDAKSVIAVAAVVSPVADAAATDGEAAPEIPAAKPAAKPAAIDLNVATPDLAKAVIENTSGVPAEAKDAKPQAAAKVDVPALLPVDPAGAPSAKPATNAPLIHPQQQAHAQVHAPAAEPTPDAHTAKAAAAQPDAPAPDVVTSAKAADAPQPQPLPVLQNAAISSAPPSQAAPSAALAGTPQAVALPVAGIAVEIAGKALAGKSRFEIRLDPPELGRIHVRLDVDRKGEVTSIITADRSDTFDLLRRDAQALERALQDAGVKTANNGLQFSLRDHGAGRQHQPVPLPDSARIIVRDDNLDADIIAPVYRSFGGNRAGVDIRV